jgi:hypothetical protein
MKKTYPFAAWVHPKKGEPTYTALGNGLMVLSRYPLGKATFTPWDNFTRKAETTSLKGILQVDVTLGAKTVELFVAHTSTAKYECAQADEFGLGLAATCDYNAQDGVARLRQIQLILDTMKKARDSHPEARPQILGVDLNTHHHMWASGAYTNQLAPEFAAMLASTGLTSAFDWAANPQAATWSRQNFWVNAGLFPHVPDALLDYLFVGGPISQPRGEIVLTERHWIQSHYAPSFQAELSDHFGILGTFNL